MNEINYWNQFYGTGKIEDYLQYKQCLKEEKKQQTEDLDLKVKEESPYAGFYDGNGNRY
jgi:hypothetical protein